MNAPDGKALSDEVKECPYCAEIVKAKAVVCKHCGRDLPQVVLRTEPLTEAEVDELIKSAPQIKVNQDPPGSLTGAVWQGDWAMVRDLILKGEDVTIPNSNGHTALDLARARGDREMIRLLLSPEAINNSPAMKEHQATSMSPTVVTSAVEKKSGSLFQIVISSVVTVGLIWYFFGGGLNQSVASDFKKQYEISRKSGSSIDVCVHAGLVAAAYLQARDDSNYQLWKSKERSDCLIAGLSR